jgi:hypothetical protein
LDYPSFRSSLDTKLLGQQRMQRNQLFILCGTNITIGSNPIKNAGLGSIIVNGATVGSAFSFAGSLI